MNVTWVIESRVQGLDAEAIAIEVARQGMEHFIVRPQFSSDYPNDLVGGENIPIDAAVVFNGTLDLYRQLDETRNWSPLGWCDFKQLSCSSFCNHFSQYMLNQEFRILTIADAIAQESDVYRQMNVDHKIFVRPNSVDKLFTGQLIDITDFEDFLKSKTDDYNREIFVSKPCPIEQEWRLFISNDRIVDGCQYYLNDQFDFQSGYSDGVSEFVSEVLTNCSWRPHPLFVMDICKSNGNLWIVELNSYNCAGLLKCDIAEFVRAASEQAKYELSTRLDR